MRSKFSIVVILGVLVATGFVVAGDVGGSQESHTDNQTITVEYENLSYITTYYKDNTTLRVVATNTGSPPRLTSLSIYMGVANIESSFPELSVGETVVQEYDISNYISARNDIHTINIGTFGDHKSISFNLSINSSSPNNIPLPEIENVEVTRATVDGEATTALRVTVRNEARVQYTPRIRATTLQTHSNSQTARVPIEENRHTIVIPLNEEPEMIVAGEVRLYTGWVHNESRISDQVEFEGTVDGETEVWDREFEPIQIDYANRDVEEYQYRNATVKSKNDEIWRERLKPVAAVAGVLLVGILLVVSVLSRRR